MELEQNMWLSELGLSDPSLLNDDWEMMESCFDEELATTFGEEFPCLISPTFVEPTEIIGSLNPNNSNSPTTNNNMPISTRDFSSPSILSFGTPTFSEKYVPFGTNRDNMVCDLPMPKGLPSKLSRRGGTKKPNCTDGRAKSHPYDHIMSERKRREQLSQLFIALSGIVPGLKKLDKNYVLGEAIEHLKLLEEKVKTLEYQNSKHTMESIVYVNKSQVLYEDDACSSAENPIARSIDPFPEIEARAFDRSLLLRIHCKKRKGVLAKILADVEQLNLLVTSTSVAPFAELALDITIVAEMDKEFEMTVKDIVQSLRYALMPFMNKA